ncbi:MAG: hypothetical protein PHR44_00805 [Candidatus Omnitrophica bacterium]|nr:hypothetical protein [Candidatus Omnitrophota bacterium]
MLTPVKKLSRIDFILAAVILLASFLRFYNLRYMEFKGDEARSSQMAVDFIEKRQPFPAWYYSHGPRFSALLAWFIIPPFSLSKNPVVATGYLVIFNIAAIWLCYKFCRENFSKRAALIASIFLAVSPWHILAARKIWSFSLLGFFIMLFMRNFFKALYKRRINYSLPAFTALLIASHLHISNLLFCVFALIMIVLYAHKAYWKYTLVLLTCFFAGYVPYLIGDYNEHFHSLNALFHLPFSIYPVRPQLFISAVNQATAHGLQLYLGESYPEFISGFNACRFLNALLKVSMAAGIIYCIVNIRKHMKFAFLALWYLIPILLMSFFRIRISNAYLIIIFPVQFIVLGVFFDGLLSKIPRGPALLAGVFITTLFFYQLAFSFQLLTFIGNHRYIKGGYGQPFKYQVEDISKAITRFGKGSMKQIHDSIPQGAAHDLSATEYIARNLSAGWPP